MEFSQTYNDYFLWNDALWKYYFENEQNSDKVLLYADEDIINKIGEENESIRTIVKELESQDYLDFFYDSILLKDRSQVKDFFYNGRYQNGEDKRTIGEEFLSEKSLRYVINVYSGNPQTTAIIQFARALSSINDTNYIHKCPCLSFVIFLIIAYGKTRNYPGINSILKERSGLNNATILPELFSPLFKSVEEWSKVDRIPRFYANQIRGEQELVGVLKYHLVLNRAETRELKDALYRYNIDWDESELSYRNLVYNRIFPIVTSVDIKNALRQEENYAFFHSLFSSFDSESYIPSDKLTKRQRGHFFLLYDRDSKSLLLKTDVLANKESKNNQVQISYDGERECGLYNALYLNGEICVDNYGSLSYEDERLKVSSINRDWLFFIMEGNYFKQVLTPENDKGCLIITKKDAEEVKVVLKQDEIVDYSNAENLIEAFGRNHNIFYVKAWKSDVIMTDKEENDDLVANEIPKGPKLTNGILNPAFKRCYLPEALPIIESEEGICINDIGIYEDKDGNHPTKSVEIRPVGNNLILSLNQATNAYKDFYIIIKDKDGRKDKDIDLGVVRIKGSNTWNGENSIYYDSWGCAYVDKGDNFILRDNCTNYQDPDVINVDNENIYEITCNHRLIPLLKSYAYARKERKETSRPYLLDRDISKIINYVRLVEKWDVDEDKVGYIKYNLINLGVLSMATDNCGERRFEVNNPRLIPIGNEEHLLYGAYTFSQFEEIKRSPDVIRSELKDVLDSHAELLIVKLKNNNIKDISGIPVSDENLADILLDRSQNMDIDIFKEVFFNTPEKANDEKKGCRFCRPSKENFFSHIEEDGQIYARYKRKDNTFDQIPKSLLKLYEHRVNKKHLMMWNNATSTISFTDNMGIPYCVEKALSLLNKNIGSREKVFGMYKCIDSPLYGTIKSFHLPDSKYKDMIYAKLSDGKVEASHGIFSYNEYEGPISLFHKIKEKENDFGRYHEFVIVRSNNVELVVRYSYDTTTAFGMHGGIVKDIDVNGNLNSFITNYINNEAITWGGPSREYLPTIEDIKKYDKLKIIKIK